MFLASFALTQLTPTNVQIGMHTKSIYCIGTYTLVFISVYLSMIRKAPIPKRDMVVSVKCAKKGCIQSETG